MLIFSLSMPNIGSWNGRWTGEGNVYVKKRSLGKAKEDELDGKSFYYNFGDGWGASVKCKKVYAAEANKLMRRSRGFCGYDWMINSILSHGEILNTAERARR